ncbi:MAG: thiamine pyrophosphate-binding protein, partial [Pirellulales bacterium]
MPTTGISAFLDLLASAGVDTIFGNPGTTELPLNDALVDDSRFRYILGLQEVPVMAMADGYAMAGGRLGVVNVHICCGLGNAMGMLYNAFREGTPLLVTAGQQDQRLIVDEPILAGDMVAVTRPWTKWSVEVSRVEDLPATVHRAIQTALTPPTGPVFVSLPLDVQMALTGELDLSPRRVPDRRVRPATAAVAEAGKLLARATRPAILAGSRVTEANAVGELVRLAERIGAPVLSEPGTTHGRLAFPSDHPLNGQGLPLWAPEIHARLADFDVLLVVGMDLLRLYIYREPARAVPRETKLIHLDEDPKQLGKNFPIDVPLLGDTKAGLRELDDWLDRSMTEGQVARAEARTSTWATDHQAARERLSAQIAAQGETRPMTGLTLMHALARVLPDDVAVVEEAVTTTNTVLERLGVLKNTTGYFGHRGWALGWGLGCALGAKLAWPDRPVLGILGEGSAMYGIQGLWSAAHHGIPVTFVVPNIPQYQVIKVCADQLALPHAAANRLVGLDVVDPEIDLVALARSLGVEAYRVDDPDELSDRVRQSFTRDRPLLIDVPIDREKPGRLGYG